MLEKEKEISIDRLPYATNWNWTMTYVCALTGDQTFFGVWGVLQPTELPGQDCVAFYRLALQVT